MSAEQLKAGKIFGCTIYALPAQAAAGWEQQRQKGKWAFVFYFGVCCYGTFMACVDIAVRLFNSTQTPFLGYAWIFLQNWIAGALVSLFIWTVWEKRYRLSKCDEA